MGVSLEGLLGLGLGLRGCCGAIVRLLGVRVFPAIRFHSVRALNAEPLLALWALLRCSL